MFGREAKRIRELESELLEKSIELDELREDCKIDNMKLRLETIRGDKLSERYEELAEKCEKLSDKHWNECRQISAYDLEVKELRESIALRDKIIIDLILQSPDSAAGLLEKCADEYTRLGKILSEYLNN